MSGIAGIFQRDGHPVASDAVGSMLETMPRRAAHGYGIRLRDSVALGRGLLWTTPEPETAEPITAGALTITADVRLDNRPELLALLRSVDAKTPDAGLILAAYEKWGEDCPNHLLGDFAFALWDANRQTLFCARDHMGVKPLHYYESKREFLFASETKALLASPLVPREIDEASLAQFLAALPPSSGESSYAHVRRLPPGHWLSVSASASRLHRYWELEIADTVAVGDYAEQFLSIFKQAVLCRMRAPAGVGAMLSGGLDSSSIACIAAGALEAQGGRLRTLSLVFDDTPELSERPFVEAVLQKGGFDPLFLAPVSEGPFTQADRFLREQDGLFLAPGMAVTNHVYRTAQAEGLPVLLDGSGGDEVVSHGEGQLHDLAASGQWLKLWRELDGLADTYGQPAWPLFRGYLQTYGVGRHLVRAKRKLAPRLGIRSSTRLQGSAAWGRLPSPELSARVDLEALRKSRQSPFDRRSSGRELHRNALRSSLFAYALEILDRSAAAAGVEPRYPFWDKRLVEFCVSLPPEEKLQKGWPRMILRRALQGVLPSAVQWRRDKLDFTPHLVRGMLGHDRALIDDVLLGDAGELAQFVNLPLAVAAYQRLAGADAADGFDVQTVWRTVVLGLWLRRLHEQGATIRQA